MFPENCIPLIGNLLADVTERVECRILNSQMRICHSVVFVRVLCPWLKARNEISLAALSVDWHDVARWCAERVVIDGIAKFPRQAKKCEDRVVRHFSSVSRDVEMMKKKRKALGDNICDIESRFKCVRYLVLGLRKRQLVPRTQVFIHA